MKRSIFTLIGIFLSAMVFSQTIVFQEDFEGSTLGFTSSSSSGNSWATTTSLQSQGLKSDSAVVAQGDTTVLTSNAFSCSGMSFVQLEFDQIAKVEFIDAALIEVSADNGNSWTRLTGNEYLGNGQFGNVGNKFTAASYTDWLPASNNAVPTNSWWKHETFNMSALVADSSQVKIRFLLIDGNNSGSAGNYGWLIDSVVVTASFSELIPPTIAIIPPYPHDTAYTSGPFDVLAHITDNTGLDTCQVIYTTSSGVTDTLGMNMIQTDTFKASIPFYGFGRSITYYVKAIDSSPAHNVDSAGPYTFYCKYSPGGTFTIGTGTNTNSTTSYPSPFGQFYTGCREQYLILASELQALGAAGGSVSSLAFDVVTVNGATSSGSNHDNYTIKLKNTTSSALTSTFETGLTQVYTVSSYQTVSGWNTFNFTTPFTWDGVSNLLVEVCFDNGASNYSLNAIVNRTSTSFVSCIDTHSDASSNTCVATTGSTYSMRPNMQLNMAMPVNVTHDIGVYQITNPTGGVVANQAFPIKVKVKNFGIDTITSGTVNWKFDGVAQSAYTLSDTLFPDSLSAEITLGTKTVSAGAHHLLAWTDNPNGVADFNVGNDSSDIYFYACPNLLSGTYTIGGTGADYATFSDAVLALNQCGISAPVTFNVTAGTYNEQIELLPINGSSPTNTVTFKAANGDSSSVILSYDALGSADNYVVKLNGSAYINFQNMTIRAADSSYTTAFLLGDVCHDVNIKNNVIEAIIPQSTDDASSTLINTLDSVGSNITIQQNAFNGGSRALSLFSNSDRSGWLVKDNLMLGQYGRGIRLVKALSAEVSGNTLAMDTTTAEYQGVVLNTCSGTPLVYNNSIRATQSQIGYGIILASSEFDSTSHAQVYNNMILLHGSSTGNTLSCGILVNNATNSDLYYNTVQMTGNQTLAASLCMFDQGSTPNTNDINIKNNIFTNNAAGYLVYIQSVDTAEFSNDYNFFYNWGLGNFGYRSGTTINDFAGWKTQTGEALNSDTIDPYYASATDLHIANNLLNGRANPISTILTDIDGDARDASTPDPGADEFTPSPYDVTAIDVLAPAGGCGLDTNETVIVRYKNIGSAVINGNFTGSYKLVGSSTTVTENISATVNPGDTLTYTFNTPVNLNVSTFGHDSTFTIKAWGTLSGDNVHQNDSTIADVESGYIPGLVTVADDTIAYGQRDTLVASGNSIYWWASDTASVELANDSFFVTPNLYDTTTYWVSDRAGSGLQNLLIGTGTNTNSTTSYPTPFGQWFTGCREQYLILASELNAMGATAGPISSLAFDVVTVNGATNSGSNHDNYTIKLKNTTSSALTSTFETGLTQVYTVPSYQTVTGWNTFNFTTPFTWDGVSNLLVEVCFDNGASNYSNNAIVNRSATSFVSCIDTHSDASSNTCQALTGSTYSIRPNMQLSIAGVGCFGDRSPVTVYITGFPQYDAGLDSNLLSPVGAVPSGTAAVVKGVLHNYGQVTLNSVAVPYEVNGAPQDTLFWTGSLPYGGTDTIVIDTLYPNGGLYMVKAFTRMPNNVADTFNTNDTATSYFNACLNGIYTIGDTVNGNADFGSFNGAIAALINAGICGNVVFQVDTGVYNEQLIIPEINGMDANNTVTFEGINGDSTDIVLQYSASSYSANYTLKLDGADWFTFKNMTIRASGSSYSGVVELAANSKHNTFIHNVIASQITSSSYARGIFASGSGIDSLLIINNRFYYGYYPIYIYGSSSNLNSGILIQDNYFEDFYYYSMYLYYLDSPVIDGNYMENGSTASYGYAIYLGQSDNALRVTNNIVNLSPLSYKYAIRIYYCDGTASQRGLVANNMISITSGTSSNYGLYIYQSTHLDVYYNTVNITSGSSSSRAAYIYLSNSTADVNFVNNNLRDSVGYTLYVSSANGLNTIDFNNYYSNSSNFAYWSGNRADLAALQTASNKDVHSVSVDPQFFSNTDLHMLSTQLSGLGTPVAAVTTDIDGELRSGVGTTIGADEVPLLPYDIGVYEILQVPDTTNEGQTVNVSVVVKNYGTDTVVAYAVQYVVNNGTPVMQTITDSLFTGMIDTLSLTSFTSPAGNSNICASTVLAADSNTFNDATCKAFFGVPAKDAYMTEIVEIPGGCGLSTDTVRVWVKNVGIDTINGATSAMPTVSYKSNTAATVTENFSYVVAPGDSVQHTFQTPVNLTAGTISDSTFNISAWIDWAGDNVSYNDTAYTSVFSAHVPPVPTVISPVNVPFGSPATLSVISNDSVLWYLTDTSSNYFHMGSSYTTGFNYNDDTLWVAALNGSADLKITETVQFKNGNGATNPYPSYMPSGDFDGFEITNLGTAPQDLSGWTVHVRGGQIINYTFPSGAVIGVGEVITCIYGSGVSVGYAGNNMWGLLSTTTISSSSTVGYILKDNTGSVVDAFASNGYTFNTADGVTSSDWSGAITGLAGQAGAVRLVSDNNTASDWGGSSSNTASFGSYNTQLMGGNASSGNGCTSARVPIAIHVTGQLAADMGILKIISPVSSIGLTATEQVKVRVRNFGTGAQSNIPVGFIVNNGAVSWDTISTTINSGDSLDYTFTPTANLSMQGVSYSIKAFTALTNPLDSNALNDTVVVTVQNQLPNYCICKSTSTGYEDLTGVSVGSWSYTNAATGANYTDYTSVTPTAIIAPGQQYNVSISSGFPPGYSYAYTCYANMFIDFNRDGDFDDAGELVYGGTTNSNNTINGTITVPFNALSGVTRMRVVLRESGNMNNTGPCGTFTWGECEDYNISVMNPIAQDAGVEMILSPAAINSNSVVPLSVQIRNYGTQAFDSVTVAYTLNGATPVTLMHVAHLNPMDSDIVSLGNITLQGGDNSLCVYTVLPGDSNTFNDQVCRNTYLETTLNLSYIDNFEGNNYWRALGQWERGVPQMSSINSAYSPVNVWAIDLDSNYANSSHDTLYSPKIYIPTFVDSAYFRFRNNYNTQSNYDGGYIQFKTSGSAYWQSMGYSTDPNSTNWYNSVVGGTHIWSGSSNGWIQSSYMMNFIDAFNPFYQSNGDTVQFRFIFFSNASSNNYDGWAIDDFEIQLPPIAKDAGVVAITTPDTSTMIGGTVNVTLQIKNFGFSNLDSIPVSYDLNNSGNWVSETFVPSSPLMPDSVASYTFNTAYTSPANTYTLCARTQVAGDLYTQNDQLCKSVSTTAAPIDAAASHLTVSPVLVGVGMDTTKMSWDVYPSFYILNQGTSPITSCDVSYQINNATPVQETFNGNIAPGDSALYTFTTPYNCPINVYLLKAKTLLTNDVNPANDEVSISLYGLLDVGMGDGRFGDFIVGQNEPNPVADKALISYSLPNAGQVKFELRNNLGQIIMTKEGNEIAGEHTLEIDASKLAGGVYYYTFEYNKTRITRKMIISR